MELHWGIDLGGTKIEIAVLDSAGSVLFRTRTPTGAERGYDAIVAEIVGLVRNGCEALSALPSSLGIGAPGIEDSVTGLQKNSNTSCLNGRALRTDLERALGVPVIMENDANCFALAEAVVGAGRGARCVFGVILGTGVGGGVAFGGRLWRGHQGIAGEWGHNVLDPSGPACYCGRSGCVESMISGPALEAQYAARSGTRLRCAEIVTRRDCDPDARAVMDQLYEGFARAIAVVINVLDPNAIVVGGGLSNVVGLIDETEERVARWVFNERCTTRIVKHQCGDSAGVFGAAMLTRG
jgi:fructokinase